MTEDRKMLGHSRVEQFSTYLLAAAIILLVSPRARPQSEYSEEVLCVVPWGDDLGSFQDRWHNPPASPPGGDEVIWAAGKWVVTGSDQLIIFDSQLDGDLFKFAPDGTLLAHTDIGATGLQAWPDALGVATGGEVLLALYDQIVLLNPSLILLRSAELPDSQARVAGIYPSDHGSFWVIYRTSHPGWQYYLLDYFVNGDMSQPQLLFQGTDFNNCSPCQGFSYASPDGSTYQASNVDMWGYKYTISYDELSGYSLSKRSPTGEVVYTHALTSDPSWTDYEVLSDSANYFITWLGDFYTLRATDDGAVLTKYTLVINHDPCCDLAVVTSMPASGIGQVPVEFDASGSYDPDPGDTLSFAWDFDGDNVYGETVHDSYTGDPDNPTHIYYVSYTGPVHVKVTDGHDGESICSVNVQVTVTNEN